jgi:hypothetical protein
MDIAAREQTIIFHEPIYGASEAKVILRPLNLLNLDELLRAGANEHARGERNALARRLAFGIAPFHDPPLTSPCFSSRPEAAA